MMRLSPTLSSTDLLRTLPGGLVLRRSQPADTERLAAFNEMIHRESDEPKGSVADWTRDLMNGRHPTFAPEDFTLVEDPQTGKIVSAMNLISQTWTYAGVPFKVGRPELVGTDPEYRDRGLVRFQFEAIHELSQKRGELLQGITGIPYFYRQFGYEMAANLDGGRSGTQVNVPRLPENSAEPFYIRPAIEADLAFITQLYQTGSRRSLLAAQWDQAMWRYNLLGMISNDINRPEIRVLTLPSGEATGYICHPSYTRGNPMLLTSFELIEGISWKDAVPTVIRYLWRTGEEYLRKSEKPLLSFGFWLNENHPAYQVAGQYLPNARRRYAWYLRVPDLPAFLRQIAPALEARLAGSPLVGHSGELKLDFYRGGIHLVFKDGRLENAAPWQSSHHNDGDAAFPGLTFLQLLFGYRTQEELEFAFPDCFAKEGIRAVLGILFPRQPSNVWPVC